MTANLSGPIWLLIAVLAAVLVVAILKFNALIGMRQRVRNAWADVDVTLKRRAELVPNLVAAVKAYATHEQSVLEAVTEARAHAALLANSPHERAEAEQKVGESLVRVLAIAESYPELKAGTNFLDLQRELAETERQIASARQYYNACVRDFNTMIEAFPSNVIAALGAFKQAEFFELASSEEAVAPSVK